MAADDLMGVIVPNLRRKLRLLESFELITGIDAVAKKLGKSPNTLLWWADGSVFRQLNRAGFAGGCFV
jgi:hypothetical protein